MDVSKRADGASRHVRGSTHGVAHPRRGSPAAAITAQTLDELHASARRVGCDVKNTWFTYEESAREEMEAFLEPVVESFQEVCVRA